MIAITDETGVVQLAGAITGTYALPVVADENAGLDLLAAGEWVIAMDTNAGVPTVFAKDAAGNGYTRTLAAV